MKKQFFFFIILLYQNLNKKLMKKNEKMKQKKTLNNSNIAYCKKKLFNYIKLIWFIVYIFNILFLFSFQSTSIIFYL